MGYREENFQRKSRTRDTEDEVEELRLVIEKKTLFIHQPNVVFNLWLLEMCLSCDEDKRRGLKNLFTFSNCCNYLDCISLPCYAVGDHVVIIDIIWVVLFLLGLYFELF